MKTIIATTIFITFAITSALSQNLDGVWHGFTKTPDNKEILFVFLFEKNGDGYTTTMAIPTFNIEGIKPKSTTLKEGKLIIDASKLGMKYEGSWNKTTNVIEGTYSEGSVKLLLNLTKGNPKMVKINRPQEPVKPYPYYVEEVVFENTEDNIALAGTFTRPEGSEKFPVVVLISGSGRQDRDGRMMTHRPFLVLSDYLTSKGIAVLRFDDRGFGESTGDFGSATTFDFAQDVLSAVSYLKSRDDVDANQIGLIVHAKTMVIDDDLAIVGSANMDYRSFDLNFEVNAMVYSKKIAQQLLEAFQEDLKVSEQIDAAQWGNRPKYVVLWEKIVRLLSPFL